MRRYIFFGVAVILASLLLQPFLSLSNAENNSAGGTPEIEDLNRQILEKKKKVEQLEASIDQAKKDIASARLKKVSFQNQLSILQNRSKQVELDIEATQEKIDTFQLEIEAYQLEIEEKEQDMVRQKNILAELIRTLHYENGKSYVEILAAYENFSDFYSRLQYLQTVQGDLGKSAKMLRLAKLDIEEKKNLTAERQKSYQELKVQLDEKKQDLSEQTFVKEDLLKQSKASEKTYQTLLENLRSQYQQIEGEIGRIESEVRKRLSAQQKLERVEADIAGGKFSWPTQSRYITARFHDPDYPFRNIFEHNAIDVRASQGSPVKAAGSGYVGRAKRCDSARCYSYVMLIHGDGLSTVYGHLSSIAVQEDQFVTRGDVIGYSGGTPGSVGAGPFVTGPHVHFEVRKNGIPVDPLLHLVNDY